MRKAGIVLAAVALAVLMTIPCAAVSSDAGDSWDKESSGYSLASEGVGKSIYQGLTNDYQYHMALYLVDKLGFDVLTYENTDVFRIVSDLSNISISDGMIKKIINVNETEITHYRTLKADITLSVTVNSDTEAKTFKNSLYNSSDRGFSELLTYLGLTDRNKFNKDDSFSIQCHFESLIIDTTSTYYRMNLADDYYPTQKVVETTEVLNVTGGHFSFYMNNAESKTVDYTMDIEGKTRCITDYDYGDTKYPVTGDGYTAKIYTTSENDGTARYNFDSSDHVATMANPESNSKADGECKAETYKGLTEYISTTTSNDLYPDTANPDIYIESISKDKKTIHTDVTDVNNDLDELKKSFGLVKETTDNSYIKQIAYAAVIVVFVLLLAIIYFKVIRNKR